MRYTVVLIGLLGILPSDIGAQTEQVKEEHVKQKTFTQALKASGNALLSCAFAYNALQSASYLQQKIDPSQLNLTYAQTHGKSTGLALVNCLGSLYLCFKTGLYSLKTALALIDV